MKRALSAEIPSTAMANLDDPDTLFLVPCRHCGELLEDKERVCPHCGKDQTAAVEADGSPDAGSAPGVPGEDAAPPPPLVAAGLGLAAGPPQEAPPSAARGAASPARLAIGIAGVVLAALLALAYQRFQAGPRTDAGGQVQDLKTTTITAPVQAPASRSARPPGDAAVASPAPAATAAGGPAGRAGPAPSLPAEMPVVAPQNGVSTPAAGECNEALVALSLCSKP